MYYLVGRRRIAARVLVEIPIYESDNITKQDVLRKAIRASVNEHRIKLTKRFREALNRSTF
jgi:hypothetical protein